MGRVKKTASKRKTRNVDKVMKRWSNSDKNCQSGDDQTTGEGRPRIDSSSNISNDESVENTSNSRPKPTLDSSKQSNLKTVEKPTGFALYSSYREPISIDNNGAQ